MNHHLDKTNLEILRHLSHGLTVRKIGQKVFLSYEAVNKRIDKMKEQTGCKNIPELIFYFRDEIEELRQAS